MAVHGADHRIHPSTRLKDGPGPPVLFAGLAVAVVVVGLGVGGGGPILLGLTVIGSLAVLFPVPSALVLLLVCQEVERTGVNALLSNRFVTLGSEVFYVRFAGVSPIYLFLVVAGASAAVRLTSPKARPRLARLTAIVAVLGAVTTLVCLASGIGGADIVRLYARPYLIVLCCLPLGARLLETREEARRSGVLSIICLTVLAIAASAMLVTGNAPEQDDGSVTLFYDGAVPAVAAAAFIAALTSNGDRRSAWLLGLAAVTIVLLSGRRNVWLALVVVLLVVLLVQNRRLVSSLRLVAAATAGGLTLFTISPGLLLGSLERLQSGLGLGGNETVDESTQGHVDDLNIAWQYATERWLWGYGPTQGPLPGLVVESESLYVHNTFLMDWLRFGLLGLIAISVLALTGVVLAIVRLRENHRSVLVVCAAGFLLMCPLCSMSAAYLSTTIHWPAFWGVAAGLLAALPSSDERRPGPVNSRHVQTVREGMP